MIQMVPEKYVKRCEIAETEALACQGVHRSVTIEKGAFRFSIHEIKDIELLKSLCEFALVKSSVTDKFLSIARDKGM